MSYQVIARKYRPQRFSEVVGQEHVTQTLANAIAQNRIAHAYLFCGPRGTGKTTIARIFAKCLDCTGGPKIDFDDQDSRCLEIAEGRSLDVLEIDGASNNGVEQVRELRETCKYAPANSRFKIYIIDEVHMLSTAAFNALLKTLEEPPEHVKFMFATTDPEKVLPTILSRCQRFDLRRISSALIVKHLAQIAGQEGVKVDAGALHAIARGADGGMRDAESTLDQLISFCGNEIAEADVLSMFGLAAQSQLLALSDAVLDGQTETALRQLDELAREGKEIGRLVTELLNHFRNLLIYRVSKGDLTLLEASEAEAANLAKQSAKTTPEALSRVMEVLVDCEGRLRDTASKKILLEIALFKAIEARNSVSLDAVLKQVQQLRAGGGTAAAAPRPAPAAQARPAPAAAVAPVLSAPIANTATLAVSGDLAQLWGALVEAVGRASPFVRQYFIEAHPVSLEKEVLTIGWDPEFADHIALVDNAKNRALIQTKLGELGHPRLQVKFIKAEAPKSTAPPAAVQTLASAAPAPAPASAHPPPPPPRPESRSLTKEDFKNDPLIQKALEIFKGQIIEIRS